MGLLALSALILVGSGFILMKNNLSALKPGGKKIEEIFFKVNLQKMINHFIKRKIPTELVI